MYDNVAYIIHKLLLNNNEIFHLGIYLRSYLKTTSARDNKKYFPKTIINANTDAGRKSAPFEHSLNSVGRIAFNGIISGNGRQYRNYCDSQNAHGAPEGEQSIREPDITPSWLGFEYCGSNIAAGTNSYCEWHVHIRTYAPWYVRAAQCIWKYKTSYKWLDSVAC